MELIKNIKLNFEGYPDTINSLSKLNIFVGGNNSGKSRLLRHIFSKKTTYNTVKTLEVYNMYENISKELIRKYPNIDKLPNTEVLNIPLKYKDIEYVSDLSISLKFHDEIKTNIKTSTNGDVTTYNGNIKTNELALFIDKFIKTKDELTVGLDQKYTYLYIPMLRGLRPIIRNDSSDEKSKLISESFLFNDFDCYQDRTKYDYFNENHSDKYIIDFNTKYPNCFIFTGLSLYEDIKKMLLGSQKERNLIKNYEDFLSKSFFNDRHINLIPNINSDVLYIQIDDVERPIYELGDGLQTIMICTFPLFKYFNENLLIFIEEPELTLHPVIQRKLLEVYNSEFAKNAQIFITTHSNHLLDITLDYNNKSIYSFEKNNSNFVIKNTTQNKDILDLLEVRNSSVFLSNCIIWVEGISDRLYIKKYLELYFDSDSSLIKFNEDKHYSFIEYGGGNIVHFNFLDIEDNLKITVDAINKNNFIIADNDGYNPLTGKKYLSIDSENDVIEPKINIKGNRLKILSENLPSNFWAYHKEIEYLLPCEIFNDIFSFKDKVFTPDELGQNIFVDNKIDSSLFNSIQDTNKYKKINSKLEFSKKSIKYMTDKEIKFNDLPNITQELIKRLYVFIKNNNCDKL